jgi:hypothetical protein
MLVSIVPDKILTSGILRPARTFCRTDSRKAKSKIKRSSVESLHCAKNKLDFDRQVGPMSSFWRCYEVGCSAPQKAFKIVVIIGVIDSGTQPN